MKFKMILFTLVTTVFALTGCQGGNNNKIDFSIGDKTLTNFIDVSEDKLLQMIESKDSFIVYVYSPSCITCSDVTPRLQSIIEDYGISIYRTTHVSLSNSNPLKLKSGVPILGFYKDGVKLKILGYADSNKDFDSKSGLVDLFKKYVTMPTNVFFIDVSTLRKKIHDGEDFLILYTRTTCPDCSFLFDYFLNDYIHKNPNKAFFIIECDVVGIRYDEENELDVAMWDAFKNEFQMPNAINEEFGYRLGHVPTFQYYKDGLLSGSAVYLNDVYSTTPLDALVEGKKVSYKFTITESFYGDLVNHTFEKIIVYNEDTIKSNLTAGYRDGMLKLHNERLQTFLNSH